MSEPLRAKNTPCANMSVYGCRNIVTKRGNILCKDCLNNRKTLTQNRRDKETNNLLARLSKLEDVHSKNKQYEKQIEYLTEELERHKKDITDIETQYQQEQKQFKMKNKLLQLKLNETNSIPISTLEERSSIIQDLEKQCKQLQQENATLKEENSRLKKHNHTKIRKKIKKKGSIVIKGTKPITKRK